MRLQIKTLNQKSIIVDIDDTKTVYDLKKELSTYPDIGVKPELQKLIYAGKILANTDELNVYNIDTKKFLVVMILKQPIEDGATTTAAATAGSAESTIAKQTSTEGSSAAAGGGAGVTAPKQATPTAAEAAAAAAQATAQLAARASEEAASARADTRDTMVQQIVGMGYPEEEVRRALAASFNNPERAIEYLIEGIPMAGDEVGGGGGGEGGGGFDYGAVDESGDLSPFEVFRSDPLFRNLRRAIQQHPDLINDAIQRVGEANPALLSLINENQMEFFSMLVEASDDEDDDESS